MEITRKSIISGITRTREIAVTVEQLQKWASGIVAQAAMPDLSADDREFVMTGIIPEEWNLLDARDGGF